MKKFKQELCNKLDQVFCDICGESCSKEYNNECASLSATWGYESKKDLVRHNIDLCEDCFDKTIDFLKTIRSVNVEKNDPLDGVDYDLF